MNLKDLNKTLDIKLDRNSDSKFISFSLLKSAINENDFNKMNELYNLLLGIDLNVAGSIEQRKNALLENDFKIVSEDKKFLAFYDKLKESFDLEEFIENLANAVYFGINLQNITYSAKDGFILPDTTTEIPFLYINKDETLKQFYLETNEYSKIYFDSVDDLSLVKFYYNYNSKSFLNRSLSAKLLYYSVLKHSVITLNLEYLDKNAIPPIILKTDNLDDEKMVQDLMTMLQMLKSNAFGVFNKDVEIDTLKQDSESKFLELIAYCDKKQNELILGGNLTGSSEKVGSQALGTVHENRLKEIIKSDAKKISKFVTNYLLKLCELNFSYAPVFDFIIDVVDDENVEALKTKAETQEIKSKTIQNLTNIGYKIPIEYIEKEFDIKGIKFESFANTKEPNHILEANKVKKLPVDHIDMALNQKAVIDKQKIDEKDINTILEKLINESNSYEEVYSKILDLYSDIELNSLEKSLTKYISSSYLIGTLEDE